MVSSALVRICQTSSDQAFWRDSLADSSQTPRGACQENKMLKRKKRYNRPVLGDQVQIDVTKKVSKAINLQLLMIVSDYVCYYCIWIEPLNDLSLSQWEKFYNKHKSHSSLQGKTLGRNTWKYSIKYLLKSRYGSSTPKRKKIS